MKLLSQELPLKLKPHYVVQKRYLILSEKKNLRQCPTARNVLDRKLANILICCAKTHSLCLSTTSSHVLRPGFIVEPKPRCRLPSTMISATRHRKHRHESVFNHTEWSSRHPQGIYYTAHSSVSYVIFDSIVENNTTDVSSGQVRLSPHRVPAGFLWDRRLALRTQNTRIEN